MLMATPKRMALVGWVLAGLALMAWLMLDRETPPAALAPAVTQSQAYGGVESAERSPSTPSTSPVGKELLVPWPNAQRPLREANADWSKVVASMSLAEVLNKAETSDRPDDRRSAIWAWAECSAASTEPQAVSRTQAAQFMHGDSNADSEFIKHTAEKMVESRNRLLEFCGDLESPALRAALGRVGLQSKREASASMIVLAMRGLSGPSQWTQEQMQAVQLVLSNPQSHPRALDHLLDHVLTTLPGVGVGQLNMAEKSRVKSTAYQLLSGDHDPDSVRNLYLCFNEAICGVYRESDALSTDQQRLVNLAQGVAQAVRTQRWDAFGM